MSGLALYTGSSVRKLDRETRAQHELEIRVSEKFPMQTQNMTSHLNTNSNNNNRFASSKIVVNVNDVNDNR